ncbi:response regulator [Roseovarius ramblicola]|uniref:Response regulator n=1 Tax=Roseovarius ramblicola TaxID=2022336 RepID=A0ABV5I6N4_9RHOB
MSRPNVLLLDDDAQISRLLDEALSEDGCNVVLATSIARFRQMQAEQRFDIYIIDLGLPDGNGLSLIQELAQDPSCGVIILSGRAAETDRVVGLEIGADDYITKPFRVREMLARVHALLRRTTKHRSMQPVASPEARSASGDVIDFDGYKLDLGARLFFAPDGREITLTTAEFNLLAALLRHRGQVLSRDQLMNAIKGRDWESYDRAVDGLVSRLRNKVPVPEGRSHYIRTVHGIGYAFSLPSESRS